MIEVKNVFNKKYSELFKKDILKIDDILKDNELTIICADFYGIQNFIFENVPSSKAYKVLRAKSAYVQIFTKVLSLYILKVLGLEEENIIFSEAGKIEILSPRVDKNKIEEIQKEVDNYFIENFFALAGVKLVSMDILKSYLINPKEFREIREKLNEKMEFAKFNKFNLQNQNTVLDYVDVPTNQTLCKTCGIRRIQEEKEVCKICDDFIKLGENLASKNYMKISNDDSGIKIFNNYHVSFSENENDEFKSLKEFWKIKSYVKSNEKGVAYSFDDLAKNTEGAENLAVIKGDVDSLGEFIKDKSNAFDSYENYIYFSYTLNNFFTQKVPEFLEENYKNTYVVFTGGDDFFIIGAWNEIIDFSEKIYKEFRNFSNENLTLSVAIMLSKENVPISYMSSKIEELLEKSKENQDKDSITLFDETVKWQEYIDVKKVLENELSKIEEEDKKSAFFYSLLELIEMSIKVKEGDVLSTMWKSKLNYSFRRNMKKESYEDLYKVLDTQIEKNPKASKMVISEFIYKGRD
ncbi:MAG: type III-A CRISPR-associated protein Cas10/Csm1 [Halarcobacter sp.]